MKLVWQRALFFGLFVGILAGAGCLEQTDDWRDRNRPDTYGMRCIYASDCASPFACLGPQDAGAYWPICTTPCETSKDCPMWTATGHCSGPITPICDRGLCDYIRCE